MRKARELSERFMTMTLSFSIHSQSARYWSKIAKFIYPTTTPGRPRRSSQRGLVLGKLKQEALLSQRGRAMLRVCQ